MSFRDFRQKQRVESRRRGGEIDEGIIPEGAAAGLGQALARARASGALNLSNRGLGPSIPLEILQLHNPGGYQEDERHWDNVDLKSLDLSLNAVEHLPEDLDQSDLVTLTKLVIRNNKLRELPATFGAHLSELVFLDLSHNSLQALPESVGGLQLLVELKCEDNQLTHLPAVLCQLPRLVTLLLARNRLESLPWHLGRLQSLQMLDVSGNGLAWLPPSVGGLTSLTSLLAPSNKLGLVGLAGNSSHEHGFEQAHELGLDLRRLAALRILDLRENAIHLETCSASSEAKDPSSGLHPGSLRLRLPSDPGAKLEQLLLSFQQCLQGHPESGQLSGYTPHFGWGLVGAGVFASLAEVHLARCGLRSLPQDLGRLASLTALDVSDNVRAKSMAKEQLALFD